MFLQSPEGEKFYLSKKSLQKNVQPRRALQTILHFFVFFALHALRRLVTLPLPAEWICQSLQPHLSFFVILESNSERKIGESVKKKAVHVARTQKLL